ncbi:hypothetical protein PGH26_12240 [Sporosarcina jeotgali]|uniref:Uncharacterized protein n=1 Tax=Sporosarcina jeotgali TaxID=3020056 RepID=A0ABZ0KXN4_9BACL|nr:hypothetical protein [Sporosarcina sp. B2O-1]WOV83644.1 hypothetical protein PGH26_12240 [Sporosarcina sp. B2O-1]
MEETDKDVLYVNMLVGTAGPLMIFWGIVKANEAMGSTAYGFTLFGFTLVMIYINYLEKKAGIPKKALWIKSILSILTVAIFLIYYF